MVDIGDMAPDFTLPTNGGGELTLSDLRGRKVVLYFYPKDNTPGCTQESIDFRDCETDFSGMNAAIIGLSKDSVKRHDNFKAKFDLNFPLASDADATVCEDYGVRKEKKNYGRTYMGIERTTFLIDEAGKVQNVWRKVKVKGHAQAVLAAARTG